MKNIQGEKFGKIKNMESPNIKGFDENFIRKLINDLERESEISVLKDERGDKEEINVLTFFLKQG